MLPVLPERDNPAEIRKLLRELHVDFTVIHPEAVMVRRYEMLLPLLNKQPGDTLNEIEQRAFRHVFEVIDVT